MSKRKSCYAASAGTFAFRLLSLILATAFLMSEFVRAENWTMQPVSIPTRWAASVNPTNVWSEYPRPQMERANWQSLNGLWQYAITAQNAPIPHRYDGQILVPFPVESALSGVQRSLRSDQRLWYRRSFAVKIGGAGDKTLLHFGAVDYETIVFVNGKRLGTHSGGYQEFTFDLTDSLKSGENELIVQVYDPTNKGPNPHGKQTLNSDFMMYTPSSGIWQAVWLERVPSTYIAGLTMTPDVDHSALRLAVTLRGPVEGYMLEAVAQSGDKVVARQPIQGPTELFIDQPRLWSPDDPYLYDLKVQLLKNGRVVDTVRSYFGLRKIEVKNDTEGKPRIFLNNRVIYNLGVVDQGFWPDGLYTAASDAALKFDLQAIKALGFNTVRKHIKIEPERWYMYCDKLGLLVWQDMPSGNNDSPQARAEFETELQQNLAQLHNHPSITTWVLFNEGWGAYGQDRLANWMKKGDLSRLLNGESGPYDQVELAQYLKRLDAAHILRMLSGDYDWMMDEFQGMQYHAKWSPGDLDDIHYYPGPRMPPEQANVASVTGEHGSFGSYVEGHVWDELKPVGVGLGAVGMTPQQLLKAYADSIEQLKSLQARGLSGSNYFEVFDVEGEQQGFLTYDREVAKVPVAEIAHLNERLVPKALNYAMATEGFAVTVADSTPEPQRYASLLAEYRQGRRDLPFLKRFALMALRQNDQGSAIEAGNAFIAHSKRPYNQAFWRVVIAITRTSKDKGFDLLRARTEEADAAAGSQAAERKLLEVIRGEAIEESLNHKEPIPDWVSLEQAITARYGVLGREALYGVRMMDDAAKADWNGFGKFYALYYKSAIPRSEYPLHSVTYQVLQHVNDRKALQTAVRAMRWSIDSDKKDSVFGRYDPTELDTYANLLYKLGRKPEALEWQEKAVALSETRDREIDEHFDKMKAGRPTWVGQ